MSVCHPLFFTLAWFGTLGNYYGHITILFFTLIFGSPVLIRLFLGQLWNMVMAFIVHLVLGTYFEFKCTIVKTTAGSGFSAYQNPENHYINPLPFPSFDLQILYFTFTFMAISYYRDEWRLNTENKHIYYRFTSLMTMFMIITTVFYLWFHTVLQILFSAAVGSLLGTAWHKLTIRILHNLQPSQTFIYPNSSTMDDGHDSYRTHYLDNTSTTLQAVDNLGDSAVVSIPLESPHGSTPASTSYLRNVNYT